MECSNHCQCRICHFVIKFGVKSMRISFYKNVYKFVYIFLVFNDYDNNHHKTSMCPLSSLTSTKRAIPTRNVKMYFQFFSTIY